MMKSITYSALFLALFTVVFGQSFAGDYLNFGLSFSQHKHEFNGHNPARRNPNMHHSLIADGVAFSAGYGTEGPTIAGRPSRVEFNTSFSSKQHLTTANAVPRRVRNLGYTTNVKTTRAGLHLWVETSRAAGWRTEIGGGVGLRHSRLTVSDANFSDNGSGVAPYMMLGARATRSLGDATSLFVEARYITSTPVTMSLSHGGTISHEISGPEIVVGLQIALP